MFNVVIAIVQNEDREVLSLRRAKGEQDGVVWGFPGGKVDDGETLEQAVVRETAEETGVVCVADRKFGERVYPDLTLHYFRCTMTGGAPRDPASGEVINVAFRPIRELITLIPPYKLYTQVRNELGIPLDKPASTPKL